MRRRPDLAWVRPVCSSVGQLMFRDLVRPPRPGPDNFGLIAIIMVPGFDMEDFVTVRGEPADVVLAQVQLGADGWHVRKLPCSGSARLLMNGGNASPRIGSTLVARERAGSGCGGRGPPLGLRRTRPGPAIARAPQPRDPRRRRRD